MRVKNATVSANLDLSFCRRVCLSLINVPLATTLNTHFCMYDCLRLSQVFKIHPRLPSPTGREDFAKEALNHIH